MCFKFIGYFPFQIKHNDTQMIQFIFQYCFNFVKCLPIGLLMHGGDGHTVMAFESQSNDPQQIPPMISPFLYAQG